MNTVYTYNVPSGVVGAVSRQTSSIVETGRLNVANTPTAFGVPVKCVNNEFLKIASGDAASVFYGLLVRTAPSMSQTLAAGFTDNTPNTNLDQGIMVKGYASVACTIGTPVRGQPVYMRVVAATGKAVGDIEATADGANNVAIPNARWATGGKDSSNTAEIYLG